MRGGRRTRRRRARPSNHEDDASSSADRLRRGGGMPPRTAHPAGPRSRGGAGPRAGTVSSRRLRQGPRLPPAPELRARPHRAPVGRGEVRPRGVLVPDGRSGPGGARLPPGRRSVSREPVRTPGAAARRGREPAVVAQTRARPLVRGERPRHLPGARGAISRNRRRGPGRGGRPAAAGVFRAEGLQERLVLLSAARVRFRHHLLQGRHRQLPGDRARPRRPDATGGLLPRHRVHGRAEGNVRDVAQVLPANRGARRVLPGGLCHCDALLISVEALFGGSFDPVHVGHLVAAETVGDALGATIRFLPAREQPLKRAARVAHGASPEQRAEMLQLAVAGNPRLAVERIELTLPTPSYTVRTLRALAQGEAGNRAIVDAIHRHEERLKTLSDGELQAQTPKLRGLVAERTGALAAEVERLKRAKHDCPEAEQRAVLSEQLSRAESAYVKELQATLNDVLPEAFATVREACRPLVGSEVVVTGHSLKWDMVPYDVQLIGGIVLHQGKIAEMATGEGKTLVATLPLYLNALAGRGAHLVTVNNYLARRDSQWMGHLFTWLGLTVGCIDDTEPSTPARRAAYQCDITYGTNNEFGFDYLRDNMVFTLEQRVQRTHAYAMIDEVDSILIDEARTPLIISGPVGSESDEKYAQFNTQVVQLVRKQTAVANDLIARAEPLIGTEKTAYEGATLLYQAQLGTPKNKKLLKLLQEPGVKSLVQRVELDVLADRKLPAREQKLRHIEEDLYFVLDEPSHSVHLTEKGVETMSPQDPDLFVVPDISHAVHEIEHDEHLPPREEIDRRRRGEDEYAQKSETLHIIHKLLQAHALYEREVDYVVQEGK